MQSIIIDMTIKMNHTFLDFEDGVRDPIQPSANSLQLRQPLLKPVPRPLTVSHLKHCTLKSPNVPVHLIQTIPVVFDVLCQLLLDFVYLRDDLILSISCQDLEGDRVNTSWRHLMQSYVCSRARLTKVRDDAVVFLHRVLQTLQGVVDGAEGEDDIGQFALQRFQVVIVDAFIHAMAI